MIRATTLLVAALLLLAAACACDAAGSSRAGPPVQYPAASPAGLHAGGPPADARASRAAAFTAKVERMRMVASMKRQAAKGTLQQPHAQAQHAHTVADILAAARAQAKAEMMKPEYVEAIASPLTHHASNGMHAGLAAGRPSVGRFSHPSAQHVLLAPVARSGPQHHASNLDDPGYELFPVDSAPAPPAPGDGLVFTTFVYPTVQGNVTMYVGIVERALERFHVFPAPRQPTEGGGIDISEDISLIERSRMHRGGAHMRPQRHLLSEASAGLGVGFNPLCDGRMETSASAQAYGCLLAMNAGFFNMSDGGCLGNVVSSDVLINVAADPAMQAHAHFGITRRGNFITGYMNASEVSEGVDGGFKELLQGNGFLVRAGKNYINQSAAIEGISASFLEEKAPRNAVGHDSRGRLLMFEADGEEDINLGLTLYEFADILTTHFDVQNAINVDGGGSSTTVYKGLVADKPTCRDTPEVCERAVTTITCVLP